MTKSIKLALAGLIIKVVQVGGFFDLFHDLLAIGQTFPYNGAPTRLDQLERSYTPVTRSYRFPCNTQRNYYYGSPENVSDVGPSDIQVVAGVGDSILAGTGALSTNILDVTKRFPEVSFALGGGKTWREYLTIPNILKQFNPDLTGFSTGAFEEAGLNVAIPGSKAKDLPGQVKRLKSKLIEQRLFKQWKIIFVLIGANDLCQDSCKQSSDEFAFYMSKVLDSLYEIPRTIIAVISMPDPSLLQEALHRPAACHLAYGFICPCTTGASQVSRQEFLKLVEEYRNILQSLVDRPKYFAKEDRAVTFLKSLEALRIPKDLTQARLSLLKGRRLFPDLSYLGPDCVHPSQKLNADAAQMIWKEMLTGAPDVCPEEEDSCHRDLYCPPSNNATFYLNNKFSKIYQGDKIFIIKQKKLSPR